MIEEEKIRDIDFDLLLKTLEVQIKEIEDDCDRRVDASSRALTEHSRRIQWLEDKVLQRLNANVSVLSKQEEDKKKREQE